MNDTSVKILVYGYGNPGRLDDGLGPALAEALETINLPEITVDSNYQLSVEDADAIARHDIVIFIDADVSCRAPFWFGKVIPQKAVSFSSHSVSIEALMEMSTNLLGGSSVGYILGVRGYEFNEFGEGLSEKATINYNKALIFLKKALIDHQFEEYTKKFGKDQPSFVEDMEK